MPLVPSLEQPTDCYGDPSSGKLTGYKFYVGVEFDVCLLVVYMGILHLVHRHRKLAYVFDILSAACLLWATYTRQFYLQYTPVSQFASDVCAAFTGDRSLTYNYLVVTIASWIASTFLEYKGVVFLGKLYKTKLRRFSCRPCLSHGRMVVIATAAFCTINSLFLTLLFWGAVQKSLENVTLGISVWAFMTYAAFMKLIHQFMEGFTFIIGIAVRDFKWRNSNSDKLFGQIAFSSFILLVYSSVLTYTFTNQEAKVWSAERCIIFVAICTDLLFHLAVFTWASYNSCCFSRITELCQSHAVMMDLSSFQRCIDMFRDILQWLGILRQDFEPPPVQLETDIDYSMNEMVWPSMDIRYLTRYLIRPLTISQHSVTRTYFMIPPLTDSLPLPLSSVHAIDHTDDLGIPYALCKWETFPRSPLPRVCHYSSQTELIVPSLNSTVTVTLPERSKLVT